MKNNRLIWSAIPFLLVVLFTFNLNAQWQEDNTYGFKINIPTNWSKSSFMDGTDKVYDYYSPDENAAIQLRAFEAGQGVTTDLLVQVYESDMIPAGTKQISLTDHISKNGIPGKQGLYSMNYNGTEVSMAIFYTVQNSKGYMLTAIIPNTMLEQKSEEVKQITQSFIINGISASKPIKTGGLGGLTNKNQPFKVTKITLCDQLDANNNAINPKTEFGTKTPEIHAVVEYEGYTSNEIVVKWIYRDWDRIITEDAYTFSKGQGGIGVVSLTKPNNDWPVGEYWVEFYKGPSVFKELRFFIKNIPSGLGSLTGSTGNIAGKYALESRSDGKSLVNYHYIFIRDDGNYDEKYQPKNSGNYVGGGNGTFSVKGNQLVLKDNSGISNTYEIKGDRLIRSSSGIVFTFKKQYN